jgi:hypothetical protein
MKYLYRPLGLIAAIVIFGALLVSVQQQGLQRGNEPSTGDAQPITRGLISAPPRRPGIDWVESAVYSAEGPFPVALEEVPEGVYDPYNKLARGWGIGGGPKRMRHRLTTEETDRLRTEALSLPPARGLMAPLETGLANAVDVAGFASLDITDCCGGNGANVPPDPQLAVGPSHIIAVVNVAFAIYDKAGTLLRGPVTFSSFFDGTPNCSNTAVFDPNVLYDEQQDRFILGIDGNGTDYCVAATTGSDPLGNWNRYAFQTNFANAFFDYPHAGVGVEAIFMGSNQFDGTLPGGFEGRVFAMDKVALYAGTPLTVATHSTGYDGTPQPMNLHGQTQGTWPTSGPHYIMTEVFDGANHSLWSWEDPFGANVFSFETDLDLNAETGVVAGFPVDVPQNGSTDKIQANDWRGLDTEYRNGFIWMTNTIACNPGTGVVDCIRWAKIDPLAKDVVDAGIIASNADYRIFPDLAVNRCEDAAIGYTKSSITLYPGVYATSLENGVAQAELTLKTGETPYSAFDSSPRRWGDYTGMTIDPNGERFWYLGEYSKNTGNANGRWGTYISSFSLDSCNNCPHEDVEILQNLALSDERTYTACMSLTAGPAVTLSSPGNLSLTAGQRVVLEPGFRVQAGARLQIRVDQGLLGL